MMDAAMIEKAEGVMYAKLRDLNSQVSTLALRLKLDLGKEAPLAVMGKDAVRALLDLTQAMEQYSTAVDKRLKNTP
jgi:hypothetical protein